MSRTQLDVADAHNLAVLHRRIADLYDTGEADAVITAMTLTSVLAAPRGLTSERVMAMLATAADALMP